MNTEKATAPEGNKKRNSLDAHISAQLQRRQIYSDLSRARLRAHFNDPSIKQARGMKNGGKKKRNSNDKSKGPAVRRSRISLKCARSLAQFQTTMQTQFCTFRVHNFRQELRFLFPSRAF